MARAVCVRDYPKDFGIIDMDYGSMEICSLRCPNREGYLDVGSVPRSALAARSNHFI
jgi:hypothetical protein